MATNSFPTTHALQLIRAERLRQVVEKGYSAAHDDRHAMGEIAQAAAAYATKACYIANGHGDASAQWVWPLQWGAMPRNDDQLTCLVTAGALLVAEIERHLRQEDRQ